MPTKKTPDGPATPSVRRLYRLTDRNILGGVCAGLADYFGVDAMLVRLIFIVLAAANGTGVFIYLLLWIILPDVSQSELPPSDYMHANVADIKATAKNFRQTIRDHRRENGSHFGGIILIAIGAVFLLHNFGFLAFWEIGALWPILLIALGLAIIYHQT